MQHGNLPQLRKATDRLRVDRLNQATTARAAVDQATASTVVRIGLGYFIRSMSSISEINNRMRLSILACAASLGKYQTLDGFGAGTEHPAVEREQASQAIEIFERLSFLYQPFEPVESYDDFISLGNKFAGRNATDGRTVRRVVARYRSDVEALNAARVRLVRLTHRAKDIMIAYRETLDLEIKSIEQSELDGAKIIRSRASECQSFDLNEAMSIVSKQYKNTLRYLAA